MNTLFGDPAEIIRQARLRAGYSNRDQLAAASGASSRSITEYELGNTSPKVSVYEDILRACKIRTLADYQRLLISIYGPSEAVGAPPVEPPWADLFQVTSQEELIQKLAVRVLALEEWIKKDISRKKKNDEPGGNGEES